MSWIILFLAFAFALLTGLFIGYTNKINQFHDEVNPIIEEYGGDSNENVAKPLSVGNDGKITYKTDNGGTDNAQGKIANLSKRYTKYNMELTVSPVALNNNTDTQTDRYKNGLKYQDSSNYSGSAKSNTAHPNSFAPESTTNGHMNTVAQEDTDSHNNEQGSSPVASYGRPISYHIHVVLPYILSHVLNKEITCNTTSKVGQDSYQE